MAVNIDGKNAIVGNSISQLTISPGGGQIAAMVYTASDNKTVLTINGKPVPGAEGPVLQGLFFSPDDKHYAALVSGAAGGVHIILDGKKGEKYDAINSGMGTI